jgi:hypothetical protein
MINPMSQMLAKSMKQMVIEKTRSHLVDIASDEDHRNEMFESSDYFPAERSLIANIPPANIRIRSFNCKRLKGYD